MSSLSLNIKQVNCKYKVMVGNNVSSKILNFEAPWIRGSSVVEGGLNEYFEKIFSIASEY